ncbi:MAG TPA: RluA family pseudouridine synthase [Candidatus Saccharimonadales bacterium]|nr:RluA family pseudouridine synthase [Candidatus Saccharimonadales bacterium]
MAAEAPQAERLDQYVVRQLPKLSRAAAVRLIESDQVLVNGKPNSKAGYKIRPNDTIEITRQAAADQPVPTIDLPVIYEDKACVVINKPAGLLSHSKGAFNPEATVATWLKSRVTGMDGERAGIVHRLDRATSGVMICAKTPEALSWLQKQFSQRRVKKVYRAVVSGVLAQEQAIIDMPIERNPRQPQTFRVGANGKPAVTGYKVLKTNGRLSLLELRPETGRTHQLRVHLNHLGHPILGDRLYGGAKAERLFLHAESLEVTLPNKKRQIFTAPVPKIFEEIVD